MPMMYMTPKAQTEDQGMGNLENDFVFQLWEAKHWGAAPDATSSANDDTFPVNPGVDSSVPDPFTEQGAYSAWAVMHHKTHRKTTLPAPNLVYPGPHEDLQISVWYLDVPVLPGVKNYDSQRNLWFMIAGCLISALQGREVHELEDPQFLELDYNAECLTMNDFRSVLKAAGVWQKNHRHPAMLTKGGKQKTPAQTKARQDNVMKARPAALTAKRAKADEYARHVLDLADTGCDDDTLAGQLGIDVRSVARTVSRARARLGVPVAAPAPDTPVAVPSVPVAAPAPNVPTTTARSWSRHLTADECENLLDGIE